MLPQVGLIYGPPLQAMGLSGRLEIGTPVRSPFFFFFLIHWHLPIM